jgi:XTP/dITP diphosphohydrolase
MLTLVTSNPAKYQPFASQLERLRISLQAPKQATPEIQTIDFAEALKEKARAAAAWFGKPVLVDDAGVVLEAYKPFPGPLTSIASKSLGIEGIKRLLSGVSQRASMECHIGCWLNGELRSWSGRSEGHLDFGRTVRNPQMPFADLFVPDDQSGPTFAHRAKALDSFEASAFELHLDSSDTVPLDDYACPKVPGTQCPFCAELEGTDQTIFSQAIDGRLSSRIVYEDEHFVVMPPLGEFMAGGLLLLTRRHILSFAHLPYQLFEPLERLLTAIGRVLRESWGVGPLIFEHGPAPERSKGICCVDHAHLNIFPARVHIHPHLKQRMKFPVHSLPELARLQRAEFGYLFVQENDAHRWVYDAQYVPTQLVRRIISSQLGIPERWHWRDYLGCEELVTTYHALKGKIQV